MDEYVVVLTGPAEADLAEVAKFIARDSVQAAEFVSKSIEVAISSLSYLPQRYIQVGTSRKRRFPIHRLVVESYLIYYRIETLVVYILTVRHGARRQLKRFD